MTLLARGSLVNIYASLDQYLLATLAADVGDGGAGLALHMHGVRQFFPPVDAPWVQVHYDFLGLQSEYFHLANATDYAREPQGYLQLNIYQRAREWATHSAPFCCHSCRISILRIWTAKAALHTCLQLCLACVRFCSLCWSTGSSATSS